VAFGSLIFLTSGRLTLAEEEKAESRVPRY
jgi:hypothetical protein